MSPQLDFLSQSRDGEAVVRRDVRDGQDLTSSPLGSDVWEPVTPSTLAADARAEQRREHDRVSGSGLEAAVLAFCREKGAGYVFNRALELNPEMKRRGFQFLEDSTRKMLDNLKGKGLITYKQRRGWVTLESVTRVAP